MTMRRRDGQKNLRDRHTDQGGRRADRPVFIVVVTLMFYQDLGPFVWAIRLPSSSSRLGLPSASKHSAPLKRIEGGGLSFCGEEELIPQVENRPVPTQVFG